MSLALGRAGAKVFAVAKSLEADALVEEMREAGADCRYEPCNLLEPSMREGLVSRAIAHFGKLDILVNNAGAQQCLSAIDYPASVWQSDVDLMLTATLDLSQQAARAMMKSGGGKIIHIASISSFQGARNILGYSTVKHALVGMTKCMANEWASSGINVNAIAPGLFETDMASTVLRDEEKSRSLLGRIPSGRFGRPDDLDGPLLFLASDASRHMHGQVLVIDGGWLGR